MVQLSWNSPAKFVKNDPNPKYLLQSKARTSSSALAETDEEPQYGWEGVFTQALAVPEALVYLSYY